LCQAARSLAANVRRLGRGDLNYFAGMHRLFRAFYGAILRGGEPPIPYEDIRRVTAIMDQIFSSCQNGKKQQLGSGALNGRHPPDSRRLLQPAGPW
jgi:predicted dehydrogenase